MNEKDYTSKIPTTVRDVMLDFTQERCHLIPKSQQQGRIGNCHLNVMEKIAESGGSQIFGWLLYRYRLFIDNGIWAWQFHSIWSDENGKCHDVTESNNYQNSSFVTFWGDRARAFSHSNGTAFNTIFICENQRAADMMSQSTQIKINPSTIYWTTNKFNSAMHLNDHSGEYKILNGYEDNIKSLENDYKCKFENGKLVSIDGRSDIDQRIVYDYSLVS